MSIQQQVRALIAGSRTRPIARLRPAVRRERRRLLAESLEDRRLLAFGPAWESMGPSPIANGQTENIADTGAGPDAVVGAIQQIILDPNNADVAFLGATNGGVWRTTNLTSANPTYEPLTDSFAGLSIGALEYDPTDITNDTVYAGVGRFSSFGRAGGPQIGLLRTTDGGDNWELLGGGTLNGRNISGVAGRGNTILVTANAFGGGIGAGVYRSTDNGTTFNLISGINGLGIGPGFHLASDPTNPNRVYASIGTVGIFRSDDLGSTWTNVSAGDAAMNAQITAVDGGGNPTNNNIEVAVSPQTGRAYASVIVNGQLFYMGFSDDQGATWTEMDLPMTNDAEGTFSTSPRLKPGGQGAIHFSIVVDPNDDDIVYIGGDRQPSNGGAANLVGAFDFSGRLFRGDAAVAAVDPGSRTNLFSPQWEHLTHTQNVGFANGGTASSSAPHADSRDMAFRADGALVEVDDGGIYFRTSPSDNTGDWFSLQSNGAGGLQVTEMHDIAYDNLSNIIISGHQDTGTAYQTAAGSLHWTQFPLIAPQPPGSFGNPIDFLAADGGDVQVDNLIGGGQSLRYASIQNLGLFTRQEFNAAGAIVSQAVPALAGAAFLPQFVTPLAVNEVVGNGLLVGGLNGIFESTDRGDNITLVSPAAAGFAPPPVGSTQVTRIDSLTYGGQIGGVDNADLLYAGFTALNRDGAGNLTFVGTGFFARNAPGMATQLAPPLGSSVLVDVESAPLNGNTVITIDSNQVFYSLNGGATWNEITGDLSDNRLQSIEYITNPSGGPDVILVGGEGGVYRSFTDDLGNWSEFGNDLPNAIVYDMDYDATDDVLVVGTLGRGAFMLDDVTDFAFEVDEFESNDTPATATLLGSLPSVTIVDATMEGLADVDYYRYTAHDTGKLIVKAEFQQFGGDAVDIRVLDESGFLVMATGTQTAVVDQLQQEEIIIPVVGQETYLIEVSTSQPNFTSYSLEIENFPAPVPTGVDLAAASDTGMMRDDNITSETRPTFYVQADLSDFEAMFQTNGNPNPSGLIDSNGAPGADVEFQLVGLNSGTTITGNASRVGTSNQWTFTPFVPLLDDTYAVSAATVIYDRNLPSETNRSQLSTPLTITVDTQAPSVIINFDMLDSSDSGMSMDDYVTHIRQPAFDGEVEAGAKVRIFAAKIIGGVQQTPELVGQGVAGNFPLTINRPGNGLFEITVEPLVDGIYNMVVELEDLAGNVTTFDPLIGIFDPDTEQQLDLEIDTLAPNLPLLDLVEASDTGRHNDDNITFDNTPTLSMTSEDRTANPAAYNHLIAENFKFRVFDRLEETTEILLYDSFADFGDFVSVQQILTTTAVLADGIHNLKLEVEDRAGNISHDFLLDVLIDTVAPPVTIVNIDQAATDTGVIGSPGTFNDNITSDTSTGFVGTAEANAIVRLYVDGADDGLIGNPTEFSLTVALPLDGDDALPLGQWNTAFPRDLNNPNAPDNFLYDGLREVIVEAEDVAGNINRVTDNVGDADQQLEIFVDTQGPQIANVQITGNPAYDLFDLKPSQGPTPVVDSLSIAVQDLPHRAALFLYDALQAGADGNPAENPGHYQVVGDHNGTIDIASIDFIPLPVVAGSPASGTIVIHFAQPLPDDRFTLTISDAVVDPAGNALDGDSNAVQPSVSPTFPSGDGQPGGDFVARFTVDSRAEIGVFALGSVYIDTNGNNLFDPEAVDSDDTNEDIVYKLGFQTDNTFAGNFVADPAGIADGFDKLGTYGQVAGQFRWLLDTNNNGVPDLVLADPAQINGRPAAGNFDGNAVNGDEVVLKDGTRWYLDTNHDFLVDTTLVGNMVGLPVVGDFDGDGIDDLGAWADDVFSLDLSGVDGVIDGFTDTQFTFGFPGIREVPVAADFNGDGVDDLGLYHPDAAGVAPGEQSDWMILVSQPATAAVLDTATFTAANWLSTAAPFGTFLADDLVPIDVNQSYQLSGQARSGNIAGDQYQVNNRQYFGFASYDSDELRIDPIHVSKFATATDTQLAVPLNPGDGQIVLQDATGWANAGAAHQRSLAWYGYTNSDGFTYPDYTYTRNVASNFATGLWSAGGVAGNVITLNQPWAGPALAAGTAVRNATSGSTYSYAALAGQPVPEAWTQYNAALSGTGTGATQFRPGTAFIKPVVLANYLAGSNNLINWRNIEVRLPTAAVPITDRIVPDPQGILGNVIDFTPVPFGPDLYASFGDQFALPVVGNFDPPVVAGTGGVEPVQVVGLSGTNPDNAHDVDGNGLIEPHDMLLVVNHLNRHGVGAYAAGMQIEAGGQQWNDGPLPDVDGDGMIDPYDALSLVNVLNRMARARAEQGEVPSLATASAAIPAISPQAEVGEQERYRPGDELAVLDAPTRKRTSTDVFQAEAPRTVEPLQSDQRRATDVGDWDAALELLANERP